MVCASWGFPALAQTSGNGSFALDRYRPAAMFDDGFAVNTAADAGRRNWGASAQFVYANGSLVLDAPAGNADADQSEVVAHHAVAHVGGFVGFDHRWIVFVDFPLHVAMSGTHVSGVPDADGAGLGDLAAGFRLRFLGDEKPNRGRLALQIAGEFPVARVAAPSQSYSGGPQPALVPQLIGDVKAGNLRLIAAVGGRLLKGESRLQQLRFDHQLTASVGAIGYMNDRLTLHGEIFGSTYTADAFARSLTAVELLVGAKYVSAAPVRLGLAASVGLTSGIGTPDVRMIATVGYVLTPKEVTPIAPASPPPGNLDGDVLDDAIDRCPTAAEDLDGVDDADGCPDPDDSDGDGVLDTVDGCPQEPEDIDKFSDDDGCPERDNDGDTLLDSDDQCPTEAGVLEQRGCPIPDTDRDGVLDPNDDCPKEAGLPEFSGCPSKPLVEVMGTKSN